MASIFRHSRSSVLLLPLLFRKWGCSHWCHVYRLLIRCQCTRNTTTICSYGSSLPFQPYGWSNPLRNRISPCILWSQLCPSWQMVGLWFHHLCGQYHHLAWSWWSLVEVHWLVVENKRYQFTITTESQKSESF